MDAEEPIAGKARRRLSRNEAANGVPDFIDRGVNFFQDAFDGKPKNINNRSDIRKL